MPGICLIAVEPGTLGLAARLREMIGRMKHFSWYQEDLHCDDAAGIAMARLSLGFVNTAPQPSWNTDRSLAVIMDGEIHDTPRLRQELTAAGQCLTSESQAELLAHGYEREGLGFFRRLDGKFVAALWDARSRRVLVVNDRFGMKPVYYAKLSGRLLVASEIKALLTDEELSPTKDQKGMAQFFTFGHLLGQQTLLEEVKALPPASALTFDVAHNRLTLDRYWRLAEAVTQPIATHGEFLDRTDAAFQRAVDRRVGDTRRLGMSLSGGLDSRTILAAIDHEHVPLTSVSMGVPGSLDHRCAEQMAALTHRDHHCFYLDERVIAQFPQTLKRMVHLTDGHYLDQCIVLPTLPLYRDLGLEVLLRGHAGELMHINKAYNYSLDAEGWAIRDDAALETWLRRRLCAYMLDGVEGSLFSEMTRHEMDQLASNSLRECLAESQGVDPPVQRISHLFITERLRRETAMSMAKIGALFETRLPFLDADLVSVLLSARPEWKQGDAIQTHILRRRKPEFLNVVNANNGAPLQSSILRRRLATFRMKVFAKLGVPGYQPYEKLGLWLRRELRDLVADLLLADSCLDRGLYRADTVRKIVRDHWDRRKNHTAVILAMMIIEAGQRQFVDGEGMTSGPGSDALAQVSDPLAGVPS